MRTGQLLGALAMLALCAQVPVITAPQPSTSAGGGNASGTIGTTNTFQQVWPSTPTRKGCTIVNGAASDSMWVEEGATAAGATKAKSQPIAAGGAFYCTQGGVVLTGEIDITGTGSDAFYAIQY